MKKIALVLALLLLGINLAFAVVQIVPLAAATVGAVVLSIAGPNLITKVSLNETGDFGNSTSNLTVPCSVYNTYMQAGAQVALGYLSQIPFDVKGAWDAGLFNPIPEFQPIIQEQFPAVVPLPDSSSVFQGTYTGTSNHYKVAGPWVDSGYGRLSYYIDTYPNNRVGESLFFISNTLVYFDLNDGKYEYGQQKYRYYSAPGIIDNNSPVNYPPPVNGAPEHLTDQQAANLAAAFADASRQDNNIKDKLFDTVQAAPNQLVPPAAISPAQIQEYAQKAAKDAVDQKIQDLEALVAANPNNPALQAELDKARADAAEKAAEQVAEQAKEQQDLTASAPALPPPNDIEFDFTPITGLAATLQTKMPFAWLNIIPDLMAPLNVQPTAPAFDIGLGFTNIHVSLDVFDSFTSVWRAIIAFFMYLGTVFLLLKVFREM